MDDNEQRLDYAWKWFNFHADQRTKMFNFMLLGLGLIASAMVAALDKQFDTLARALGIAGFLLSLAFWRIDSRNKQLYEAALDVLFDLEQSHLFSKDGKFEPKGDGKTVPYAIGWRIHQDDRPAGNEPSIGLQFWQGRHRRLMPAMILGLGLLFLLVGLNVFNLSQRADPIVIELPPVGTVAPSEVPATGASATGGAVSSPPFPDHVLPGSVQVTMAPQPRSWGWLALVPGLVLLALGAVAWAGGRRTLGITQLAAGALLSAVGTLGITFKGEVKLDPKIELRLFDKLDARLRVGPSLAGGTPRLLGSLRFEGFASGEAKLACDEGSSARQDAQALGQLARQVKATHDVVVVAVGSTDRDPLGPALRRQRESNTGLARARVTAALACMGLQHGPGADPTVRIVPIITGPAYTPERDASAQARAEAMRADRAVELHVLAVPRGR